jgi:hypothetical protein
MALATLVLTTPVGVVDVSSAGLVDQIYESEYHLLRQMDNACAPLLCAELVITLSLCELFHFEPAIRSMVTD